MNKTNKYSWLTFIPVGIACFYFYLHTCPYLLLHKEQTTLFVYASEVLYSYLNKPAVLSCLTGDYLTQFFRTPVTASILMGGDYACIGTDLLCRISEMDKRLEVYDTVSDLVIADYGTFPIWHRETDLKLMDLQNGQIDSLPTINSDRSDTYHSWSSNSRWFVFASKRGDGQYGKPYFAYISPDGTAGKPFVLPQKDPEHYDYTFKSYNIPELSSTPVPFDAFDICRIYQEHE